MDRRAYTVDPNSERSATSAPSWWQEIGPTTRPAPYADRSWVCLQDFAVEYQEVPSSDNPNDNVFDNFTDFQTPLYEVVLDGGLLYQYDTPKPIWDGGLGFGPVPVQRVKHTFASVKVYDKKASSPGKYSKIVLDVDLLSVDSTTGEGVIERHVLPSQFQVFDNGDDFNTPVHATSLDGGDNFAMWNAGEVYDGIHYNNLGEYFYYEYLTGLDGDLLIIDGVDYEEPIEITKQATNVDDTPPGTLLGQVDYEMVGTRVEITDWSHYNWSDALPVRKAVKALINSLPSCVDTVTVRDRPTAMWTSLGFIRPSKGSDILVYNKEIQQAVPY